MSEEDLFQKRLNKIFDWFKNPFNLALVAVLLFGFGLRLYYFVLTKGQAAWWDEAEYASKAVSIIKGTPSGMASSRELVIPYFWSMLYVFVPSEILWRFTQFLHSFAIVVITYFTAKAMFNRGLALIATALVSCSTLLLFYTGRLLMYTWGAMFFMLAIYLFYEGYVNRKGIKWIYASALTVAFGTITYFSSFLAAVVIIAFLILTEGFKWVKKKEIYKPAIVGSIVLGGYMLFSQLKFGFLHPRLYQAVELAARETEWSHWMGHFPLFPHLIGNFWILFLVIGMLICLKILLVADVMFLKHKSTREQKSYLIMLLWFWGVMLFFVYMAVFANTAIYEGFITPVLPGVAIIAALGMMALYNVIKPYSKVVALIIIIALVAYGVSQRVEYSDSVVKRSIPSFQELIPAGLWIKENSQPGDKIFSYSHPQITYYSERFTRHFKRLSEVGLDYEVNESNFAEALRENEIKFVVLSLYESPPPWVFAYPQNRPDVLTPVHAIPARGNPEQPAVIIYGVNYE